MIHGRFKYCIFFSFFFFQQIAIQAQHDHIRFKRLTINDGLSLSSVYTIFQDSKGFMWFGTEDGLNKYDGKSFRIYRPEPGDTNSLTYKWTESIYEDSHGMLWFGSKVGLTQFDPSIEKFVRFTSKSKKYPLAGDAISFMVEKDDKLWVGTFSGINRIDLQSGEVDITGLLGEKVNIIVPAQNGEIWIGTQDGIFLYNNKEKSFKDLTAIQTGDESGIAVNAILENSDGTIWLGAGSRVYVCNVQEAVYQCTCILKTDDFPVEIDKIEKLLIDDAKNIWIGAVKGLFRYDLRTKNLISVIRSIDSSHSLAINSSKSMHVDKKGELWYGTFGEGIYRIDMITGRSVNLRNNPADLQSLSENSINCIYEDRGGNLWFGTFGAGINIYNPQAHKFGYISHQPLNENSLSSNFVWTVLECEDGTLWIGTNDEGLSIYNPETNNFRKFTHDPENPYSLSHASVRKVYQDSKNRIWVGTDGGGLNRFYSGINRFRHYMHIQNDTTSISSNSVRVIYEDMDGNIWIGTRNGLNLFDPDRETFRRFIHNDRNPASISNDFVYSAIHQDRKGDLWVGTYGGGLNCLDLKTGKFRHFVYDPNNPEGLSDNIVFCIFEETSGILWIGTNDGLNRFDPSTGKFRKFGIHDGLPNEVVYGMVSDKKNNLWLSTNKGICRFNLDTYHVKNFTINDGLQSNEFNGGAFHKGKSGLLYFGGVYGLNIIDPELDYRDENNAQVVITKLEVLGNEARTSFEADQSQSSNKVMKIGDAYYVSRNISYASQITLDFQQRFFSIEYAALNSLNTDQLKYQYIMEGLDDDWNEAGSRDFVTFANMQPGAYTLRVRSENADGVRGISEAVLEIVITPPFWKTWWFYVLEFIIILTVVGFFYRYLLKVKTNRLLRVQNEKINQANEKLLASENHLKQLIATKDKFFSIISHDLRNPFTSLLSISELMTKEYEDLDEEDKITGLKGIHDSANRIYNLLENLLTWSRAQSGSIKFEPVRIKLENILKENLSLHAEIAEKKGITFESDIPSNNKAYGDRDMISTVIRNLLGNAIKFSPKGNKIKISIDDDGEYWKINVIDNGVGINRDDLSKIFQIHTKFKTEGTEGEKGTGLGLIICKEFVEKNGGQISVISEEGKGSTFSFTVPKG